MRIRALVSGIVVHSYLDRFDESYKLEKIHKRYSDQFLLCTEASVILNDKEKGKLGSWSRAEDYARSIINNLSHWVTGWVDGNLALNLEGGPNWQHQSADAPIIVNTIANEFYKQAAYYVMGHFSKYVPPGSMRIKTTQKGHHSIKSIGFVTPDNATILVLMNQYKKKKKVLLEDPAKGSAKLTLPGNSIHSVIYW